MEVNPRSFNLFLKGEDGCKIFTIFHSEFISLIQPSKLEIKIQASDYFFKYKFIYRSNEGGIY